MISVIVPTRGRPKEFKRMLDSMLATQANKNQVVAYLDDDDKSYEHYPNPLKYNVISENIAPLVYVVGPRIILTDCWNKCLSAASGEILNQGNDDMIFKTKDWDIMVENEFLACIDKILLVHGSDEGQHFDNFGAHSFVHKRWVETLGYFIPPYFSSDFGDAWLNEIANSLNRRKYLPFILEHLHPLFKKAPMDATYADRLTRHFQDRPQELYYSQEMTDRRRDDTKKLEAVIGGRSYKSTITQPYKPAAQSVKPPSKEPEKPKVVEIDQKLAACNLPTMARLGMMNEKSKLEEK